MRIAKNIKSKYPFWRISLVGDGEIQEGQIWEAVMYAGSHKLNNLCVILDNNRMQNETYTNKTLDVMPLKEKWQAFKWNVIDIDGHSFKEIDKAFNKFYLEKKKPTVIIANTIKGKGFKFAENNPFWHHKNSFTKEEIKKMHESLK